VELFNEVGINIDRGKRGREKWKVLGGEGQENGEFKLVIC
jgi:hypothetical protein